MTTSKLPTYHHVKGRVTINCWYNKMATVDEGQKEQTKRDRAFLGQLPSDFLRVEESPRSEQRTNNGQRYASTLIY